MINTPLITRDDDLLGGTPVFTGTRVPVKTLLDYLEGGHSLAVFLDHFPTVSHQQAQDVLALLSKIVTNDAVLQTV